MQINVLINSNSNTYKFNERKSYAVSDQAFRPSWSGKPVTRARIPCRALMGSVPVHRTSFPVHILVGRRPMHHKREESQQPLKPWTPSRPNEPWTCTQMQTLDIVDSPSITALCYWAKSDVGIWQGLEDILYCRTVHRKVHRKVSVKCKWDMVGFEPWTCRSLAGESRTAPLGSPNIPLNLIPLTGL